MYEFGSWKEIVTAIKKLHLTKIPYGVCLFKGTLKDKYKKVEHPAWIEYNKIARQTMKDLFKHKNI